MKKSFNLDKSNWKSTQLGDIAKDILDRVNNPSKSSYDRFVGLENFVKDEIVINSWKNTKNLNSSAKAFKANDVLFARRNTYLRRASLVDFDGCCSGDAFVLREDENKVVNGFLVFLLNSNKLWDYANSNSAGTMSKRVKWRDLKKFKFLLPPKKQQIKLLELLWAMHDVLNKEKIILKNFEITLLTSLKKIFSKFKEKKKLIDLCIDKPRYGANSPANEYDNNVRYIRITDIVEFGELSPLKVSAKNVQDKYLLKYGDFLFARTADPGRTYYYKNQDGRCCYAGYLIKFELNISKILPEFLYYYTQTIEFKSWVNNTTRKGTLGNINSQEFSKVMIPLISISNQKNIIDQISKFYEGFRNIKYKIYKSNNLQRSLINELF